MCHSHQETRPVPGPRDHEHRLGQERERECDPKQERGAAAPVEAEVAEGGSCVEGDSHRREGDLPAVELFRAELACERLDPGEGDRGPAGQQCRERHDQRHRPAQHALGRRGSERQPRGRREDPRDGEPERRRELEAGVLAQQHARRGERVEPEEGRGRYEGERDQEEAGVAPAPSGGSDGVAEADAERGGCEHEPEMRRVGLPALVEPRMHEQQHEHPRADEECKTGPQPRRSRVYGGAGGLDHRSI